MSTPNRYHLWAALECHAFSKAEAVLRFSAEEDGMWVQWQDYARLKAEVERLTAWGRGLESDLSHARVEISFLKAEAEKSKRINTELLVLSNRQASDIRRLHKAGDAMVDYIERTESSAYYIQPDGGDKIADWNAAKEGKQP